MRIAVLGAGGKVGREVCRLIEATPDLILAERIGAGAAPDGSVALTSARLDADVVIDFSAPAGTMALLDRLSGLPAALVVGTTGFDAPQHARLRDEAARRPVLVGANFTLGFQEFRAAALALAAALPGATLTLGETYNARKKPVASGTTEGLLADLRALASAAVPQLDIRREGDVAGVNDLTLELGASRIEIRLTVNDRAAYAAGAIASARWLVPQAVGFWQPADMIADKEQTQ